jgi:hypothetical protein
MFHRNFSQLDAVQAQEPTPRQPPPPNTIAPTPQPHAAGVNDEEENELFLPDNTGLEHSGPSSSFDWQAGFSTTSPLSFSTLTQDTQPDRIT